MTRTTGKEALVELLRSEGVEYVFGIPGATEIRFMDALEKAPDIQYVLGLQEVVCAGMAEGYARASGRPGFLNLHTAPGLAAASPMLYNAKLGGVPLVVTVGQNDSRLLQKDPHLSGDIVGIGAPHVKWGTEIGHASDIPVTIRRAFKMAVQPPAGPVLVSIPQDVLEQELDHLPGTNTSVLTKTRGDAEAVRQAAAIIARARRPLMLVESGVARCGAVDEVVRLAETIGAGVRQAWMSDVNFPVGHPQYLGDFDPTSPQGIKALQEADVLIAVGCSLFAEAFSPVDPAHLSKTKIVHIDEDPWELGKNLATDCAIQGHIGSVLAEIDDALDAVMSAEDRAAAAERAAALTERTASDRAAFLTQVDADWDRAPIALTRLMSEIAAAVGPNTIVVDECWSASAILRNALRPDRPGSFLRARKGGSIGWGLPAALGVKLGAPASDVVAVIGDGSAAWSMQALWTAARYKIPVTYVITNNGTYRQVKLVRRAVLGDYPLDERHEGMEIDSPVIDFSALAASMGVQSRRVTEPGAIAPALAEAITSGVPRLVEVMVENRA